jgi:hypothetical protein
VLAFAARRRLMLWPAALALLALAVSTVAPPAAGGGGLGTATWGITFTAGIPFVLAAGAVARWLGPEWGAWIIPVSVPLGLVPYLAADLLVNRLARLRSTRA